MNKNEINAPKVHGMKNHRICFLIVVGLLFLSNLNIFARASAEKLQIEPDSFLRGYDPVTITFRRAIGPSGGGPLDDVDGFAGISPLHPGQ